MKRNRLISTIIFSLAILLVCNTNTFAQYDNAIVDENVVFEETNGLVAVEAEFFYKQTKGDVRKWYQSKSRPRIPIRLSYTL